MAFLCTFSGLTLALIVWVSLYALASHSHALPLVTLAPYLEAFSITGQCLFIVLTVIFSWLTYPFVSREGALSTR